MWEALLNLRISVSNGRLEPTFNAPGAIINLATIINLAGTVNLLDVLGCLGERRRRNLVVRSGFGLWGLGLCGLGFGAWGVGFRV